jgi:hypothetical protein
LKRRSNYWFVERGGRIAIHNRIYNELIVNYMTSKLELSPMQQKIDIGGIYRNDDRTLNMEAVLVGFRQGVCNPTR